MLLGSAIIDRTLFVFIILNVGFKRTMCKAIEFLSLFDCFKYEFMKNALIAILLITPVFGLVGTLIVHNRMAFFSDALGHCTLTGIAIGSLFGLRNMAASVVAFSILFALGVSFVIEKNTSSADTVIGVFASSGMALGIVILSFSGGFARFSGFLIGDVLSITRSEIKMLFVVFVLVIAVWAMFFNKIMFSGLSRDLAVSKRINYRFYNNIFVILIALIVASSIKWVGIMIINSLLIIPVAAARNVSHSLRQYTFFSICFSVFSGVFGLFVSYFVGVSTGAAIVLTAALIFFTSLAFCRKN
jgi:zinc transport system permease protein